MEKGRERESKGESVRVQEIASEKGERAREKVREYERERRW